MNKGSVAVIAVHGVGHHEAGQTSASIAKQLQCADPASYGSFACTPTHIAVSTEDLAVPGSSRATVAAQSSKLPPTVAAAARGASPDAHGVNATDIDFTAITLAGGGALAYLSLTRLMGGVSLGKLSRAFASLRVVIDTAIDVDN